MVNIDDKINATQRLIKIVKNRKTPLVVNKQEKSFIRKRNVSTSLSYESYSYDSDE